MSTNLRGYHSKKEVFINIIHALSLNFIFVQETHVYSKNSIKIPGYSVFYKNRKQGSKGGVALLVHNQFKDAVVLVHESEKAEMIAVKVSNTIPQCVLMCYYGQQENSTPAHEINDHLAEIFGLIEKYSEEGCAVVCAGDWNVSLGNEALVGNHPAMSRAGMFVKANLDSNPDLSLVNARFDGSSVTHIDASGGRNKCLDLVVANAEANSLISQVFVDNEEKFMTPYRYSPRDDKRVYSDHVSVYWEMNIAVDYVDSPVKKVKVWNYNKQLGTGTFAWTLDRNTNKLIRAVNRGDSMTTVMRKLDLEVENAKYRGYGIKKVGMGAWRHIEDNKIATERFNEINKVVQEIRNNKKNYRLPLRVFAMRKSIMSARGDMISSIIHPDTKEVVETRSEVYGAMVRHNEITLEQNPDQDEDFEKLTDFKMKFVKEMQKVESEDPAHNDLYWEEYLEALMVLAARNKSVYDDLKRWGPEFKIFVYMLLKRIFETEEIPDQFNETKLQALFKNKGSRKDLSNYRFLHLKTTIAKLFEYILMQKVKNLLYKSFPEAQIGGLPDCRTTEHLYVLVVAMLRAEKCKKTRDGFIVIYKDVVKAFDKISIKHELFATAMAGVKGKLLRLLELLNKETTFEVVGDMEERKFVKEYASAQGTGFTCTSASLTMSEKMEKMVELEEEEKGEELGVRLGPEQILINQREFVDDEIAFCKDAEAARHKGRLITASMDEINVRCHPVKTKYMIVGSERYVKEMEEKLAEEPIKIQGFEVGRTRQEKYLGMMFNEAGSRKTIEDQIKFRFKECDGKVAQIKMLLDTPKMRVFGALAGVKILHESIIHSTACYSAGVWLNMTRAHYELCNREDKRILFTLLKINSKTNYYTVLWELDMLPFESILKREKIGLVTHLAHSKVSTAGKLLHAEARSEWKPGLVYEVRKWCNKLGLPDPVAVRLSAEVIGEAVRKEAREMMFEKLAAARNHNLMLSANRYFPDYIYNENRSNLEQKVIFSWRLGILGFKSRYKHLYNNTECVFEKCPGQDSLHHAVYECEFSKVKKPRNTSNYQEMLKFLLELNQERIPAGVPLIYI